VTARVTLARIVLLAWLPFLAGCGGESERAGDGGSQTDGTQAAAEGTPDERTVEERASERGAAARAGDAVARAGRGAVARAGDAVARAGAAAAARDGDKAGSPGTDGEDLPQEVTLDVGGERGTPFSGACSVGGDERRIGGRVPESYAYEPDGERVECEIRKDGPGALEVVLVAGDDVRSVQRQAGAGTGTITLTYSGASGVSSSGSQTGSIVSSIVSSTKSRQ
jgi:hypothetical protein